MNISMLGSICLYMAFATKLLGANQTLIERTEKILAINSGFLFPILIFQEYCFTQHVFVERENQRKLHRKTRLVDVFHRKYQNINENCFNSHL